jgi:hypothetical protein
LTEKYAKNATAVSQLLSVTAARRYFASIAVFLKYGATVAAMQIRRPSAIPAIMIWTLIHIDQDRFFIGEARLTSFKMIKQS